MRSLNKQQCQTRYDRELQFATERLERLRDAALRLSTDSRAQQERKLDELRGRLNRASARAEGLRRASIGMWDAAEAQAAEAFRALDICFEMIDPHRPERPTLAA